jgi:hypothetical protein
MKAISFVASTLLSVSTTTALSQSAQRENAPKSYRRQASAQLAFARLATLAGNWTGQAAVVSQPRMSAPIRVSLRVTSGGSALLQEMLPQEKADDPSNGDNDPITMLYVEDDRLILLMYCDGGKNRARLAGTSTLCVRAYLGAFRGGATLTETCALCYSAPCFAGIGAMPVTLSASSFVVKR